MDDLAFVKQHNMVAYLEKAEENTDFHQILDFLTSSLINFALTVSPTIYASYIEQFWNTACLKTINSEKQIHANIDGKAVVVSESSVRRDLHLNDEDVEVGDEAINEEMLDSVERAATTATSLEAEHASGTINKTQFTTTLNEPFSLELGSGGHTLGSGEDIMEHQIELMDIVPNTPHDSPLLGVNIPGSDEGSLALNELMDMVTKLSHRVLDLEKVKTAQAKEIAGLKRRVTKLEQRQRSRILKNYPFRFGSSRRQSLENQGKIGADDTEVVKGRGDTEVNSIGQGVSTVNVPKTVSTAAPRTPPTTTTVFDDEDVTMAMAQTLIKGKELDEELKVERERQEDASKVAIAEMFDEVQARMDADYELAARMTQEEHEKYTIEERARLLAKFFERRKKQLAAERVEAIRNKPPTKTQLRNLMMTYLKNMGSYKHSQLKGKSYEEI
ncbi:hypothetical protein Tco_1079111 [Tanacetum coccineum]|uniref:Xylulose kinase-1 n=1 Tax=Tanacetum coccineum TaxID=301880 RepID=A0ABQ5HS21_9ASTR